MFPHVNRRIKTGMFFDDSLTYLANSLLHLASDYRNHAFRLVETTNYRDEKVYSFKFNIFPHLYDYTSFIFTTREERHNNTHFGDHDIDWAGYVDDLGLIFENAEDLQNGLDALPYKQHS